MCFKNWTIIFTTLIFTIDKSACIKCIRTNKCSCSPEFSAPEIEYKCPDHENPDIKIMINNNQQLITMQCLNASRPLLNVEDLPKLDATFIQNFNFENCFVNDSYTYFLNQFNPYNINRLTIKSPDGNNKNNTVFIDKKSFMNLNGLSELTIQNCKATLNLSVNFLENTPNLQGVFLENNGINDINGYFKYVPKLKKLVLSRNLIKTLQKTTFKNQKNLTKLFLNHNKLTKINKEEFANLKNLEVLDLSHNQISVIEEQAFADLEKLRYISLDNNKIISISNKTFKQNVFLERINISYNPQLTLKGDIFHNLTLLVSLDLSNNQLVKLTERIFLNCINLQLLRMENNKLRMLPNKLIRGLKNLKELYLFNNEIDKYELLLSLENLEILDLSGNKLIRFNTKVLSTLSRLERLNLSGNEINTLGLTVLGNFSTSCPLDINLNELILEESRLGNVPNLTSLLELKHIYFADNRVTFNEILLTPTTENSEVSIDLSNNNISSIYFSNIHYYLQTFNPFTFRRTNLVIKINPIIYDCLKTKQFSTNSNISVEIRKFITRVDLLQNKQICADDYLLVHSEKPLFMDCPLQSGCPCHACFYRSDQTIILNCSYQNASWYPLIHNFITIVEQRYVYKDIILNLSGNALVDGPIEGLNYEKVTYLDLSYNKISRMGWMPPKLKELNLNENNLKYLNGEFIDILRNATFLERIFLRSNPWLCDCKALDLQKYLKEKNQKFGSLTADVTIGDEHE